MLSVQLKYVLLDRLAIMFVLMARNGLHDEFSHCTAILYIFPIFSPMFLSLRFHCELSTTSYACFPLNEKV